MVGMNKSTKLLVSGAALAVGAMAFGASPAAADNGGGVTGGRDSSGPYVSASDVHITGDARGGGGLPSGVSIPATCWWEPINSNVLLGNPPIDPNDPESVKGYFDWSAQANAGTSFSGANLGLPRGDAIEDAINRAKGGEKITWYEAVCRDGINALESGFIDKGGDWAGVEIGIPFQAFPTGEEPEPIVAAQVLADAAKEILDIALPQVERNPEIPTGAGAATLVNWQTYFWVNNVGPALGTPVGHKEVRVQVGDAFAELVATGQKITVSTPSGVLSRGNDGAGASSVDCSFAEARQAYGAGATDANSCNVRFTRASVGQGAGWPVTVTSHWDLNWTGQEADGTPAGDNMGDDPQASTVNVPVAESQAVVDNTGN
jgi:hypothetical protein